MILRNETDYSTADLRRFFHVGLYAMGAEMNKNIRVVYSRRGIHWGCATVPRPDSEHQGSRITMTIPKGKLNLLDFARVFEHEVSHNLGLSHGDMDPDVKWCRQHVGWLDGLEIRFIEHPRVVVDHVAEREAKARKMMEKWEKKMRRARTMFQKWSRKVRYYERRQAAKPHGAGGDGA